MCRVWVTLSRASLGLGLSLSGSVVGFPVASLPGACPRLAYLAVSPECLVVSPGACNLTVTSALAHATKLGSNKKTRLRSPPARAPSPGNRPPACAAARRRSVLGERGGAAMNSSETPVVSYPTLNPLLLMCSVLGEMGGAPKGGSALCDMFLSSATTLLVKCPSVQWQLDGLTIHTKKWVLGAGFLGAPPISLASDVDVDLLSMIARRGAEAEDDSSTERCPVRCG